MFCNLSLCFAKPPTHSRRPSGTALPNSRTRHCPNTPAFHHGYPLRFDFKCNGGSKKLQYTHKVSAALVRPDADALQADPSYMRLFVQTIQPLVQQHEAACRGASARQCENCGQPTVKTLMTIASWLHNVPDPFLNVWVTAACHKGQCEIHLRQAIQTTMPEGCFRRVGWAGGDGRVAPVFGLWGDGRDEEVCEVQGCCVLWQGA